MPSLTANFLFALFFWAPILNNLSDHLSPLQSSTIAQLSRQKFDFTTLLSKGITYSRYAPEERTRDLCEEKIRGGGLNGANKWRLAKLGPVHEEKMDAIMLEIEKYVYDPVRKKDKVIKIESYSMRRALEDRVKKVYKNTGVFTEISRIHPETIIKKTRGFRQANFLNSILELEEMGLGFHDDVFSNQGDQNSKQLLQPNSQEKTSQSVKTSSKQKVI